LPPFAKDQQEAFMTRTVAIALLSLAALSTCLADGDASPPSKIEVVQRFVRAFLTEDAKVLSELTADDLQRDFRTYFWFRGVIQNGEHVPVAAKQGPAIKMDIKYAGRMPTLSADLRQAGESDGYRVVVGDKRLLVHVDDEGKVVSVDDDDKPRIDKGEQRNAADSR
jgi:hypothetical protein